MALHEKPVINRKSFQLSDLQTPSVTQNFPLGETVSILNSETGKLDKYVYVLNYGTDLDAKSIFVIGDSTYLVAVPATSTIAQLYGVANYDVTADYYFFAQIEGQTTCLSTTDTVSGNTVCMEDAAFTVTDEGGTTPTADSIGIVRSTVTGSADVLVDLIQDKRATTPL